MGTTKQEDLSIFVHPIVELLTEMNNPMIVVTEPSDGRLPAVASDDLATEIRLQFPDARPSKVGFTCCSDYRRRRSSRIFFTFNF